MDIKGIGANTNSSNPVQVTDIINQITKFGVQRSNRFSVQFENCPVEIDNGTSDYSFFATMCQLPERTITMFSDSVGPYSPGWDIPLKTQYDENFIINFLVDRDWSIRSLIESWMDYVSGTVYPGGYYSGTSALGGGLMPESPSDGSGNTSSKIIVKGFKTKDNALSGKLTLYSAWPKTILPATMDTNAMNQPLIMSVVFSYRYYRFEQGE